MLKVQKFLREFNDAEHALDMLAIKHDIKLIYSPTGEKLVNLNYNQIDKDGKHNPINMECRGLVLDYADDFKVVAKGFNRFFNFEESPTVTRQFNWKNFSTLEKVDGSLILIYHYKGTWRVNSRGSFGDKPCGDWDKNWEEAVWSVIDETAFDLNADKNCTYICEICTPYNMVVTSYDSEKVFLLNIIDNNTFKDVEIDKSSYLSVGFSYPKTYSFDNIDHLKEMLEKEHVTFEGFVVKDDKGMRLKIKKSSYVELHRLRGNNGDNLNKPETIVSLILQGEKDEIICSLPYMEEKFNYWESIVKNKLNELVLRYEECKIINNQKDFALKIQSIPNKLNWLMYQARKNNSSIHKEFYSENNISKITESII